jgi:hypothetical protein
MRAIKRGNAVVYNDGTILGQRVCHKKGSTKAAWNYAFKNRVTIE